MAHCLRPAKRSVSAAGKPLRDVWIRDGSRAGDRATLFVRKRVAASIDPRVDAIGYVGNYRSIQGVAQGTPISQETALEILRLLQREHVWMQAKRFIMSMGIR